MNSNIILVFSALLVVVVNAGLLAAPAVGVIHQAPVVHAAPAAVVDVNPSLHAPAVYGTAPVAYAAHAAPLAYHTPVVKTFNGHTVPSVY